MRARISVDECALPRKWIFLVAMLVLRKASSQKMHLDIQGIYSLLNNVLPSLTDSPSLSDAVHGGVGLEWPYNLTVAFKVA